MKLDETLTIPASYSGTIDLNGKTLSIEKEGISSYESIIENFGDLTIKNGCIVNEKGAGVKNKGVLTLDCDVTAYSTAVYTVYSGITTIDGGTYTGTSKQYTLIDANGDNYDAGNPEMTINGGVFKSYFTNVAYNDGATGAVNGGTFESEASHNIYVGGTEGGCDVDCVLDNCEFLASGQESVIVSWFEAQGADNAGNPNTFNGETGEEKGAKVIKERVVRQ